MGQSGAGAPLVARGRGVAGIAHHVIGHRGLVHDTVVNALQVIIEPPHGVERLGPRALGKPQFAHQPMIRAGVMPGADDQLLSPLGPCGAVVLPADVGVDRALLERVEPAGVMDGRCVHHRESQGGVDALPVGVVAGVAPGDFQRLRVELRAREPVLHLALAQCAAHVGGIKILARPGRKGCIGP